MFCDDIWNFQILSNSYGKSSIVFGSLSRMFAKLNQLQIMPGVHKVRQVADLRHNKFTLAYVLLHQIPHIVSAAGWQYLLCSIASSNIFVWCHTASFMCRNATRNMAWCCRRAKYWSDQVLVHHDGGAARCEIFRGWWGGGLALREQEDSHERDGDFPDLLVPLEVKWVVFSEGDVQCASSSKPV